MSDGTAWLRAQAGRRRSAPAVPNLGLRVLWLQQFIDQVEKALLLQQWRTQHQTLIRTWQVPLLIAQWRSLNYRAKLTFLEWWITKLHIRGRSNVTWLPTVWHDGRHLMGEGTIRAVGRASRKWSKNVNAIGVHGPNDVEMFQHTNFTPYVWRPYLGRHLIQRETLVELILADVRETGEICGADTPTDKRRKDHQYVPDKHRDCYCVRFEHAIGKHECQHEWRW